MQPYSYPALQEVVSVTQTSDLRIIWQQFYRCAQTPLLFNYPMIVDFSLLVY